MNKLVDLYCQPIVERLSANLQASAVKPQNSSNSR